MARRAPLLLAPMPVRQRTPLLKTALWVTVAVLGAVALGSVALHRGETINSAWLVVAAICVYALGYRF